jgi:hypothetical protein
MAQKPPIKNLPAQQGEEVPVANLPYTPTHDGHSDFNRYRQRIESIKPPAGYKPIASRNTSGAGAPAALLGKKQTGPLKG